MISVVINTYNAEQHLRKVLESVEGFDEIVICDMESTDSTLEIAKEYGCKTVCFPKRDYTIVEPARNFAIQQASHEWVLVVDADELVTPALKEYLYNIISDNTSDIRGIYIPRRNYFMGTFMHSLYPDYILRFFRKDSVDWPPIIHIQPTVQGKVIYAPKNAGLAFEHLANDTISNRLKKTDIYTDNECIKKNQQALWHNGFSFPSHTQICKKLYHKGRLSRRAARLHLCMSGGDVSSCHDGEVISKALPSQHSLIVFQVAFCHNPRIEKVSRIFVASYRIVIVVIPQMFHHF